MRGQPINISMAKCIGSIGGSADVSMVVNVAFAAHTTMMPWSIKVPDNINIIGDRGSRKQGHGSGPVSKVLKLHTLFVKYILYVIPSQPHNKLPGAIAQGVGLAQHQPRTRTRPWRPHLCLQHLQGSGNG